MSVDGGDEDASGRDGHHHGPHGPHGPHDDVDWAAQAANMAAWDDLDEPTTGRHWLASSTPRTRSV